ncbi:hypothetical protein DRJ17_01800 [Candidatus Woesearchaeota archaeon]|nr:MAG: hypothetical protein DRJ17_01800 [Candidatus Woesearchaeota archaeon]
MKSTINFNDTRIYPCLIPEEKALNFKRSTCEIKINDKIEFIIKAKDATALRATTFAIKNLLLVYEKTRKVIENG